MAATPLREEKSDKVERIDDRLDKERMKAVEMAIGQIEKQFGKGSIMRLGGKDAIAPIPVISTGSISLDWALGVGGLPRGRVIEIFGPESSGKTTLALQTIAQAQKLGGVAAFVDAEHALDAAYAQKLGVDLENLLVSQPDNGEQALEIVEVLIRSNGVDVVVVDSVAALVPRAEIEGEMGDAQMGLQARLMSQALRKLTGVVSKSKTCLIFINQLREKILHKILVDHILPPLPHHVSFGVSSSDEMVFDTPHVPLISHNNSSSQVDHILLDHTIAQFFVPSTSPSDDRIPLANEVHRN
jgi:archaellum biogenesis ATPase FlaH